MTIPPPHPGAAGAGDDFHVFEQDGWERAAPCYADAFVSVTAQAAGPLLDAAAVGAGAVGAGARVLDLACGPGHVAAAAARRGAAVTGIDFSAAMVAIARKRHAGVPGLAFMVGDAEALPVADAHADAVVMNFGMLHLARPERAMREAHRVLRPGGRFAFTVWSSAEETAWLSVVHRAVRRLGATVAPPPSAALPAGPPQFLFGDPAECTGALAAAGFGGEPAFARVALLWRLDSPDAFVETMSHGTVRTAGLLRTLTPEARAAVGDAIRAELAPHATVAGTVELPAVALLTSVVR